MIDQPVKEPVPRKPYASPVLHVYGGIASLTNNFGPHGVTDSGGGAAAGPKTA
jgi:hypothetical protein